MLAYLGGPSTLWAPGNTGLETPFITRLTYMANTVSSLMIQYGVIIRCLSWYTLVSCVIFQISIFKDLADKLWAVISSNYQFGSFGKQLKFPQGSLD